MDQPTVAVRARALVVPPRPAALVVVISGSDAGPNPVRSRAIAHRFHGAGLATLPFKLLTPAGGSGRCDVAFEAERLVEVLRRFTGRPEMGQLPLGLFGDGAGAVALWAAAELGPEISSVVSLSGRPELAAARLADVTAPTLFIVGDRDQEGLERNMEAQGLLRCATHLRIVPGATDDFTEPAAFTEAVETAARWFATHALEEEATCVPVPR
jgi:putative phosphoribosyl transferase